MTKTACICFDPESLETKVTTIAEEIAMAYRWSRPSIVFAIYTSAAIRKTAQKQLASELIRNKMDQVMYQVEYDATGEFVSLLSRVKDGNAVISIDPINSNTPVSQISKLIDILDSNKRSIIENGIRMVVWLTQEESALFAHSAPDLWASRHRVIELDDEASTSGLDATIAQPAISTVVDRFGIAPAKQIDEMGLGQEGYLNFQDVTSDIDGDVQDAIAQAVVAWQNGDSQAVQNALATACKASQASQSKFTKIVCIKAKKFFAHERGAFAEEQELDLKLAEIEKTDPRAFYSKTIISTDNNAPITDLESAMVANPGNIEAAEQLAKGYEMKGLIDQAIAAYKVCVKLATSESDEQRYWSILGKLYTQVNGVDQAIAAFAISSSFNNTDSNQAKVDVSQLNADMWTEIGNVLLRGKDMKQAEAAFQQAIRLDSNNGVAFTNLGVLYSMMGLPTSALENLKKGASLFTDDHQKRTAWNLIGDQYRMIGNYTEAVQSYQTADDVVIEKLAVGKNTLFTNNLFSNFEESRNK